MWLPTTSLLAIYTLLSYHSGLVVVLKAFTDILFSRPFLLSLTHKGTCRFIKLSERGAISIIFHQGMETFYLIFWKSFHSFVNNPRMYFVYRFNSGIFFRLLKPFENIRGRKFETCKFIISYLHKYYRICTHSLYSQLHVH